MRRAWGKFCSAISTVSWYCCLSSRMASMVRLTRTGARPTEGSSIRRMRGASIRARPRASICCSPPLMEPASWRRRSAKRGKAEKQKSILALIWARALGRNAPRRRFSSTVRRGNSRRPSGTNAMPRSTISSVARPIRSWRSPSISAVTVPALGRTMPMMLFMSVLLPLPLVPSSTTVSPLPAWTPAMVRLLTKIRPLDFAVADHVVGAAVGDFLAGDQHDETLGEAHHGTHDVLDEDDRDAAFVEPDQQRDDVVDFGIGEPRHRLVGNQELGLRRHGAGEFELAHVHLGEIARQVSRAVGEAHEGQELLAASPDLGFGKRLAPRLDGVEQRHLEIVSNCHAGEGARQLEAARH